MQLSTEELVDITADAATLFLGMIAEDAGVAEPGGLEGVVATIPFGDPTVGALTVACPPELGELLAATVLEVPEPSADDVADAVGELANVIAGGVAGMLGRSVLSLPTVTTGYGLATRVPGAETVRQRLLLVDEHPLVVALHETPAGVAVDDAAAAAAQAAQAVTSANGAPTAGPADAHAAPAPSDGDPGR